MRDINLNAQGDATIGGDVVGRDKITNVTNIYEAATPTINALHQLPPTPRDFIGRKAELNQLMAALENEGATIFGLWGPGGVGKTTLALKLAEQLTSRYPDAQYYLDLKGVSRQPLPATDAMRHVIRTYQPTVALPESETGLSGLYQSVLHGKRALLLMDNASGAPQVELLMPPATCCLLVTSRQHFALPGIFTKDLDMLPSADARALLRRISPRLDDQAADEIAKLCGYLPLAIRLAGSALAERRDLSPADYMRRLKNAQSRLELIDASLSLSYEMLNAEMQKLWCTLAVFPGTFEREGVAAVWNLDLDLAKDTLSELLKYSLVEYDEATDRYRLHDLAHLFADARLSEADRATVQKRHAMYSVTVLQAANTLYKQGGEAQKRGLDKFDLEWDNIQVGQAWAEAHTEADDTAAKLCNSYPHAGTHLLMLRQHPRERIRWNEDALAAARRLKDRVAEAGHLGGLGIAYAALGEFRHAIELQNQRLVIAREIGNRKDEAYALGDMGHVYDALNEARHSIKCHEQALTIDREIGNRRHESSVLYGLGNAYLTLREPHRAIEYYKQALIIDHDVTGDKRGEGSALSGLGRAHTALGDYSLAIEFFERRLTIAREIGDQTGEGSALWNMSLVLDKLGDRAKASVNAEAALKIFKQVEHPNTAKVREQLAEWRGVSG